MEVFPDIAGLDNVRESSIVSSGYFHLSHWEFVLGLDALLYCVSSSEHVILYCTSFMHPLKYRARKHSPQQGEKQKIFINMKLNNMLQN